MPRSLDRRIFKLTLFIFLPLAFILNFLIFRVYMSEKHSRLHAIEAIEMEYVQGRKAAISGKLTSLGSDLAFLSSLDEVIRFLEYGSNENRETVESIFLKLSKSRGFYDQIRLISLNGMELVRVDSRPLGVHVVPPADFQDKSSRYYFRDVMKTEPGRVYMSHMDLNVEHGQVEVPYVPMLRLGIKVTDRSGAVSGVLLLNCYGDFLFPESYDERFSMYHSLIMLDSDGYYLKGLAREDEWGFMFEDKKDLTMAVQAPDEWDKIRESGVGQFYWPSGFYSFVSISPMQNFNKNLSSNSHSWVLLSFISPDKRILSFLRFTVFYLSLGIGTTVLLLMLIFWAVSFFERDRNKALVDPLTSLWNRRSFLERIQRLEMRMGDDAQACVALIDLGNFKSVNDSCGHHAGDEALVLTARVLLSELRTTDFLGRYGGDEFVILFPDLGIEDAKSVMSRLADKVKNIQIPSCTDGAVVADWGLVHYPSESSSLDSALKLADARMYENKRKRKESIKEE